MACPLLFAGITAYIVGKEKDSLPTVPYDIIDTAVGCLFRHAKNLRKNSLRACRPIDEDDYRGPKNFLIWKNPERNASSEFFNLIRGAESLGVEA